MLYILYFITDTRFKKNVLLLLNKISKQVGTLEIKVMNLNTHIDEQADKQLSKLTSNEEIKSLYKSLPFTSEEGLKEFDEKLNDKKTFDFLVIILLIQFVKMEAYHNSFLGCFIAKYGRQQL